VDLCRQNTIYDCYIFTSHLGADEMPDSPYIEEMPDLEVLQPAEVQVLQSREATQRLTAWPIITAEKRVPQRQVLHSHIDICLNTKFCTLRL
jgi:hypothetical protein